MSENASAAEWLRGIADKYQSEDGFGCREIVEMLGFCCDEIEMCNKCRVKAMKAIADRIEAERALPEGMEWPRFEDGELVRIGDELEFEGKTMLVCDATFYADDWALWCDREDMSGRLYGKYGERVKRPAPKVLDADGVPIEVGDVVYFVADKDDGALTVECIDVSGEKPVVDLVYSDERGTWHLVDPEKLTHERPDSWRLWGEDLDTAVKVGEVDKVEMMRRTKALAKREVG